MGEALFPGRHEGCCGLPCASPLSVEGLRGDLVRDPVPQCLGLLLQGLTLRSKPLGPRTGRGGGESRFTPTLAAVVSGCGCFVPRCATCCLPQPGSPVCDGEQVGQGPSAHWIFCGLAPLLLLHLWMPRVPYRILRSQECLLFPPALESSYSSK